MRFIWVDFKSNYQHYVGKLPLEVVPVISAKNTNSPGTCELNEAINKPSSTVASPLLFIIVKLIVASGKAGSQLLYWQWDFSESVLTIYNRLEIELASLFARLV